MSLTLLQMLCTTKNLRPQCSFFFLTFLFFFSLGVMMMMMIIIVLVVCWCWHSLPFSICQSTSIHPSIHRMQTILPSINNMNGVVVFGNVVAVAKSCFYYFFFFFSFSLYIPINRNIIFRQSNRTDTVHFEYTNGVSQ